PQNPKTPVCGWFFKILINFTFNKEKKKQWTTSHTSLTHRTHASSPTLRDPPPCTTSPAPSSLALCTCTAAAPSAWTRMLLTSFCSPAHLPSPATNGPPHS